MLGLGSGTAAADSESEGIWAMMATARAERGRGGERERGTISSHQSHHWHGRERTSHWMEWNGRREGGRGGEQREDRRDPWLREKWKLRLNDRHAFSTTCYDDVRNECLGHDFPFDSGRTLGRSPVPTVIVVVHRPRPVHPSPSRR